MFFVVVVVDVVVVVVVVVVLFASCFCFLKSTVLCPTSGVQQTVFSNNTCFQKRQSKLVFFWLAILAPFKSDSLKQDNNRVFREMLKSKTFQRHGQFLTLRFWPKLMVRFWPKFCLKVLGKLGQRANT